MIGRCTRTSPAWSRPPARPASRSSVERFPEGTRTAADAARAVGCDVGQIVKSLVFIGRWSRRWSRSSRASNRVDPAKLAAAVGAGDVRRADGDEARAATGFAIGGVPPFGHVRRVAVVVDRDLLGTRAGLGRRRPAGRGLRRSARRPRPRQRRRVADLAERRVPAEARVGHPSLAMPSSPASSPGWSWRPSASLALRCGRRAPGLARRLAGPARGQGRAAARRRRPSPTRPVRVVGRIRCRDPLEMGGGERLVAFHRDVEVRVGEHAGEASSACARPARSTCGTTTAR